MSGRLRRLGQTASGNYHGPLSQPAGVTYKANNNRVDQWAYDAAGNVLSDGVNRYEYDAEGRQTGVLNAMSGLTGYVYDAEGRRAMKVLVNNFGTPQATTTVENEYLLGLSGEQDRSNLFLHAIPGFSFTMQGSRQTSAPDRPASRRSGEGPSTRSLPMPDTNALVRSVALNINPAR